MGRVTKLTKTRGANVEYINNDKEITFTTTY